MKLEKCLEKIDCSNPKATPTLLAAVRVAEDHRNEIHCGVDPIAIVRALIELALNNRVEGASTIEQQFVRVATGNYEKSLRRKLEEQMLAIGVSKRRSRHLIAEAYLANAYFGHDCIGINALELRMSELKLFSNRNKEFAVAALLKHPIPRQPSELWLRRLDKRINRIEERLSRSAPELASLSGRINECPCARSQPLQTSS